LQVRHADDVDDVLAVGTDLRIADALELEQVVDGHRPLGLGQHRDWNEEQEYDEYVLHGDFLSGLVVGHIVSLCVRTAIILPCASSWLAPSRPLRARAPA